MRQAAKGQIRLFSVQAEAVLLQRTRHNLRNPAVGADTHHGVYFGHIPQNFFPVALRQTPRNHQRTDASFFFELSQLQNFLNGLRFGALNEAAGVDDGNVRHSRVFNQPVTRVRQITQHHFRIHLVLRAAETHHPYFYVVHDLFFLLFPGKVRYYSFIIAHLHLI